MADRTVWKLTEVASLNGERLLVLQGELDIVTAPELDAMLTRMREHDHPVVLDLSDVTFMDSTGLTTLMDHWLAGERDGWSFSVRAASRSVRRVVELAGVDRLLDGA
jgi:anti-sigma B factor antagonist